MKLEKLEQLAQVAGIYQLDRFNTIDGGNQIAKLAELIIKDCLQFVEPMPGSGDIDDLALEAVCNDIKTHFGIE